jgi:nucleolar protein TMA23
MNARAYLQSQGWRGEGHTLHPTNDSIGLNKRISVSRKNQHETRGLGATQYVQEQWWLSSLQEHLSGLEKTSSGGVAQKKVAAKKTTADPEAKSQLYRMFVRGGLLEGSVGLEAEDDDEEDTGSLDAENKIEAGENVAEVILAACLQSTLKASVREESTETSGSSEPISTRAETKEERRVRREAKRNRKEERRLRRAARDAEVNGLSISSELIEATGSETAGTESREERRVRKQARRKPKVDRIRDN